jgi:toxin-antitoxin system PIN domain toxin
VELPDVNVLIYAFRPDLEHHQLCLGWLEASLEGESPIGVSPLALSAVVRITTNARAFREPNSIEEAIGFCDDLTAQPNCHLIEPGASHWAIFCRLCIEAGVKGARVSDAWYAALAIEHGCDWITMDRDFRRFSGLKWRQPYRA